MWRLSRPHVGASGPPDTALAPCVLGEPEVDGKQPPELRGAKDAVFAPPHKAVKLATRFDGPADPDTPHMSPCHLPYHDDLGMTGQFLVGDKGQRTGTARAPHSHTGH
ncbi:hypothetical protein ACFO9E_01585 [Streptomyces maoxianensis]|uniref:Uncharacterized protein n=1 Tax=Streptomyces maoxianensis TaxID=1459942 RepID=A0ABV9FXI3_9ACTN